MAASKKSSALAGEWFWVDRWMGSSAFTLAIEPRGLYREMLSQAWYRGASLPNDHGCIRRITGCSEAEWARCWPLIARYWRVAGDLLVNDTQLEIYAESMSRSEQHTEAGRIGAAARWKNHNKSGAQMRSHMRSDVRSDIATQSPAICDRNASPYAENDAIAILSGSGSKYVRTSTSDARTLVQEAQPRRNGTTYVSPDDLTLARDSMAEAPPEPVIGAACVNPSHLYRPACLRGVCIYPRLHAEFVAKLGGEPKDADRRLKAFYSDVITAIPTHETIGDDAWDFWRARYQERFAPKKREDTGPYVPSAEETEARIKAERAANAAGIAAKAKRVAAREEKERLQAKINAIEGRAN